MLERVPEQFFVHTLDGVLLHGDGRAEVILGALCMVCRTHFTTLILGHDFLELLVGVKHVSVYIDCWLKEVALLVQIVKEGLDRLSLLLGVAPGWQVWMVVLFVVRRGSPGILMLLALPVSRLDEKDVPGEILKLLHLPSAVVIYVRSFFLLFILLLPLLFQVCVLGSEFGLSLGNLSRCRCGWVQGCRILAVL